MRRVSKYKTTLRSRPRRGVKIRSKKSKEFLIMKRFRMNLSRAVFN
jgi:hypothetical protein